MNTCWTCTCLRKLRRRVQRSGFNSSGRCPWVGYKERGPQTASTTCCAQETTCRLRCHATPRKRKTARIKNDAQISFLTTESNPHSTQNRPSQVCSFFTFSNGYPQGAPLQHILFLIHSPRAFKQNARCVCEWFAFNNNRHHLSNKCNERNAISIHPNIPMKISKIIW